MSDTTTAGEVLDRAPQLLRRVIAAEARMAREMMDVVGLALPDLRRALRPKAGCCEVPPPCWMPRPLGECVGMAAPCQRTCVRLRVTNCDRAERDVRVGVVRLPQGWKLEGAPATLALGPFERATAEVCVRVPDGTPAGETHELLVWVSGCRDHYLRWTVRVGTGGSATSCHEVAVDDCPDYRHHWYDHFYCARGCSPQPGAAGNASPFHG